MAIEGIALLGFHFEEKLDYVRVGFNLSNVESNQKEHVFFQLNMFCFKPNMRLDQHKMYFNFKERKASDLTQKTHGFCVI